MPNRYYTELRERKVKNPPKKTVGGVGSAKPAPGAASPAGFPSCKGTGGTFGAFQKYVGEAGIR